MRGGPGIGVTNSGRWAGRLLRTLAGLLTVLALLAGSGAGLQAVSAQGDGGASGAAAAAMDDEEDSDERDNGIDLPFIGRDDESGDDASEGGSAFALTAYVCSPGDDTALRDRMLVESSTDPDAFFEDGIELDELREVCAEPEEALTYTLTDFRRTRLDTRELGGERGRLLHLGPACRAQGVMYTLGVDGPGDATAIRSCSAPSPAILRARGPSTTRQTGRSGSTAPRGPGHTCEWFSVDLGDAPEATSAPPGPPPRTRDGLEPAPPRSRSGCTPGPDDGSGLLEPDRLPARERTYRGPCPGHRPG